MSASIKSAVPVRAVVTGASSGIGQQIAISLASLHSPNINSASNNSASGRETSDGEMSRSQIVVHYCQNLDGAETTADLVRQAGAESKVIQCDLTDPDDRARLIQQSWDFLQTPTTWVNNAGADVLTGDNSSLSFSDKLRLLFETDVFGTFELARNVVDEIRRQDETHSDSGLPPSMTFIGWDQAPLGMEGDAGQMFGPVKAAVMAFANSLAQEVSPGIRVNTVSPGWIQTAWGQSTSDSWDRRAKKQSLMNRWGKPQDVAQAVAFVSNPENTFCTGQTINVNGGWNRRFE